MGHPLDLRCHPLQYVCNSFKVEGERELIGEVMVKMVGEVMVEMVRAVVVHLSRHSLLHTPPPPYLPITRDFYTPTDLHITFHTPRHLHIFTISGVTRASLHSNKYHLIIPPFIIPLHCLPSVTPSLTLYQSWVHFQLGDLMLHIYVEYFIHQLPRLHQLRSRLHGTLWIN